MTDPSLQLLTSRLSWPSFRVRTEAASQLAALIVSGCPGAKAALLTWLASRKLESEAAAALGIIQAFGLGTYVSPAEVDQSVQAPSLLSEQLFERAFPGAQRERPNVGYAPDDAKPTPTLRHYFDRHIGQVLPRMYRSRFVDLGRGGLAMLERWFVEWCWLQSQFAEPLSGPADFLRGQAPRNNVTNPQVRQTEVYLSAWLRTIAFAVARRGMPKDIGDDLALAALAFNSGLATLGPRVRPQWSSGWLRNLERDGSAAVAQKLWRAASRDLPPNQTLIALRVSETDAMAFAEVTLRKALHRAPLTELADLGGHQAPWSLASEVPGELTGPLKPLRPFDRHADPLFLTSAIHPSHYGRYHVEFFPSGIQVAHPGLIDGEAKLAAYCDTLIVHGPAGELSTWSFWNADWEPSHPAQISRLGGFITTIDTSLLATTKRATKTKAALHLDMVSGTRKHSYEDAVVDVTRTWIA